MDGKICATCVYYRIEEEYWHDHYLIPEHHYCAYKTVYNEKEVDPGGCCKNYKEEPSRMRAYIQSHPH